MGKNPKKPGFRGGGIQRGQSSIWHTILLARSSVLHLGRWAGAKGACGMAAQDAFAHAGQAGFAIGRTGKDEAYGTLKPPVRQRMCGLGWSGATGKHVQPRRPRCIKALVSHLSFSHFSQNASFPKMQKCVIARKPPLPFSANWDSPDRAKSGLRDLQNGAFSSCPIPQD